MRRTPLKRGKRVNPVNRKRKAARFRIAFLSVERVLWVKSEPCAAAGRACEWEYGLWCRGPMVCAHVVSRGAGGTWRSVAPLCEIHHNQQHSIGIKTFALKYNLDLAAIAAELATRGPQE